MNPDTDSYPLVTCKICRATQQATYSRETRDKMVERQLCFLCLFWTQLIEGDRTNFFVANGHHYQVFAEDAKGARGFGGRQWAIYPNAGGRIMTTNLWHQGEIPERFRERLPDDCTIMEVPRRP